MRLRFKDFRFLLAGFAAMAMTSAATAVSAAPAAVSNASEPVADLDAWSAAKLMGIGVNIGNTLDNTTTWETGWGNPPVTKDYIQHLAALGFRVVRLPVAWDTYANNGRIDRDKLARVGQIADWITSAGMFCVVNIHWDGGWIDSDDPKRFAKTLHTFSPEAERKYQSYWTQIATYFADRDQHLAFVCEGVNLEIYSAWYSEQFMRKKLNEYGSDFVEEDSVVSSEVETVSGRHRKSRSSLDSR